MFVSSRRNNTAKGKLNYLLLILTLEKYITKCKRIHRTVNHTSIAKFHRNDTTAQVYDYTHTQFSSQPKVVRRNDFWLILNIILSLLTVLDNSALHFPTADSPFFYSPLGPCTSQSLCNRCGFSFRNNR